MDEMGACDQSLTTGTGKGRLVLARCRSHKRLRQKVQWNGEGRNYTVESKEGWNSG